MITVYDWTFCYEGVDFGVCTSQPEISDAWEQLFRAVSGNMASRVVKRRIRQSVMVAGPLPRKATENYFRELEEEGL